MEIGLIITIVLAIAGWGVAFWQMCLNRKWQKKDKLSDRRYEVYSQCLKRFDEISTNVQHTSEDLVRNKLSEFAIAVLEAGTDIESLTCDFQGYMIDYMLNAVNPVVVMQRELSALKLVASKELLVIIEEMLSLATILYQESIALISKLIRTNDLAMWQTVDITNINVHSKRFEELQNMLLCQMRKEIEVK